MFNIAARVLQPHLESYFPGIPADTSEGILRIFCYSFTVSTLLSGGNPIAGLKGGALTVSATTIYVATLIGFKKLNTRAPVLPAVPNRVEPVKSDGHYIIHKFSFGMGLYLGNKMGLTVSNKASFFATVPFILWNTFRSTPTTTPLLGIIVI